MGRQRTLVETDTSRWLGSLRSTHADLPRPDAARAACAAALAPPLRLPLSQWADEHFVLSAEAAAVPGRWTCLPYQREILDVMSDSETRQITLIKSARLGFALSVDTPLPTPTGWTTMGKVRPGEFVLGRSGRPTRVEYKSPVYHGHTCWDIEFDDGSHVVADSGHRWFVETDVSIEHIRSRRVGRTGRPYSGEQHSRSGVLTTEDIAWVLSARRRSAVSVPTASTLELPEVQLPVAPYVLGAWLGDGDTRFLRITQHRTDADEMAELIRRAGVDAYVCYRDKRWPNNASILIGRSDAVRRKAPISEAFRELGLLGGGRTKFIPAMYLRASAAQRLELLRGLMDTDGSVQPNGWAEFANTNENLAAGVQELVHSLGGKATMRLRPPQTERCLPQWRVVFRPPPGMVPFALKRKAARVSPPPKPSITTRRRIRRVTKIDSEPVQCLSVDADDHLFLAGRHMIPTHNTLMGTAAISYFVTQEPSSILIVEPTIEDARGYSRETLAPAFRDVPLMRAVRVSDDEATDALMTKTFPGGVLTLVGANSGTGFRRISRRIVFLDEVDAYPASSGSDGDAVELAKKRAAYFANAKIIAGSTPLVTGLSRIESMFLAGDQRRFHVPCPHCGKYDFLAFSARADGRGHVMGFTPDDTSDAHFVCSGCGCVIEPKHKMSMLEAGKWVADKPFRGHASFAIWGAYSCAPTASWPELAAEFVAAKRTSKEALRVFVNTTLGESFREASEALDYERLFERREQWGYGAIPVASEEVAGVTCGVDVQRDRVVYEVVAHGKDRRTWSIDAGVLPMRIAEEGEWATLDGLVGRTYHSTDGVVWPISQTCIDSGDQTQSVYAWSRTHGREVACVKGNASMRTALAAPTKTEVNHRGKKLSRGVLLWSVGVDVIKQSVMSALSIVRGEGSAPPRYCHFGADASMEFFRQLTAEVQTTTKKRSGVSHEWVVQPGRENHWLDARVYAMAGAMMLGLDRGAGAAPRAPQAPAAAAAAAAATRAPAAARPPAAPAAARPPAAPRGGSWISGGAPRRGGRWI